MLCYRAVLTPPFCLYLSGSGPRGIMLDTRNTTVAKPPHLLCRTTTELLMSSDIRFTNENFMEEPLGLVLEYRFSDTTPWSVAGGFVSITRLIMASFYTCYSSVQDLFLFLTIVLS